ncbi:MAG: hypothetical protein A2776_02100 [Candidatus Levybacteria bacterium RIFCSPHIGHO2_01_FULL_40_10]|nr:MAG: hypothetical protein A2776_02100 [Candidatus Levybacteria bacterium RIFCSPHIGHO2_01_FULL_40_10]
MGKIRLKVIGDETAEQEQKEEHKRKAEQKEARKAQVKGVGLGGGERINTVGVTEEEIAKELDAAKETRTETGEQDKTSEAKSASGGKESRGNKKKKAEARIRSKRHVSNTNLVANVTTYPIKNGIEVLRKFKKSNFDETVELHINVKEKGISGQVSLPHGTGKKLRIRIADDALVAEVEAGKINFDVLVATPDMMPKLAKVARTLGPKGLMPNPKNGTISDKPEQVVEKLSAGQVNYKTEAAAPLIHLSVGKLSFEDEKLVENIKAILASIGPARIDKVTLKSSMSPAVTIQV